jgi:hypothetical protein
MLEQRLQAEADAMAARGGERGGGGREIPALETLRALGDFVQQLRGMRRPRNLRSADQGIEPRRQGLALDENVADGNCREIGRGVARLLADQDVEAETPSMREARFTLSPMTE